MPRIKEALGLAADRLAEAGVDSPRLSAQVLLAYAIGADRVRLLTDAARDLTSAELVRLEHFVSRREQGEPVAYILGRKEFYGLDFIVTPDTLIPRPETEHIVEEAERLLDRGAPLSFLDLGTGSGALAVTLAVRFPRGRGTGLDTSGEALEVARRNARAHGVAERLDFLKADFTAPLPLADLDLVVSNPPYVGAGEFGLLSREVSGFEPESALVSPQEGMWHIRALAPRAAEVLAPGGLLLLEMGSAQGDAVLETLEGSGQWQKVRIIPDLAGLDRVAAAWRCG